MSGAIVVLSVVSMLIFTFLIIPLFILMAIGWKNEYTPGFCGFGATILSAVALIPALISAGIVLALYSDIDQRTRLIGLVPVALLLLAVACVQGLLLWKGRRR